MLRSTSRARRSATSSRPCSSLLQSGQSQRLSARSHAGGAAGARLHAIAGAAGRPRPERCRRVRARAEQERPGDAVADARHRLPALDHLQRRRGAARVRRRRAVAGPAEAGSGRKRRPHPGGRIAGAGRGDLPRDPDIWLPDNLFLLQELLPHDPDQGIVRLEFLGGELLYAMRVKSHGRFNLCPSPVCNPDGGTGVCAVPEEIADAPPVEFFPYPDVPRDAVATAKRIVQAARLDVGGIEYLETRRRPAGLLRHQRQLELAPVGRGRVWLRPVREGGRFSRARNSRRSNVHWSARITQPAVRSPGTSGAFPACCAGQSETASGRSSPGARRESPTPRASRTSAGTPPDR